MPESLETWTLRFVVLTEAVAGIREDVAATRADTQQLESETLDTLDTIALALGAFLVWMALGQAALVAIGRRRVRTGGAASMHAERR